MSFTPSVLDLCILYYLYLRRVTSIYIAAYAFLFGVSVGSGVGIAHLLF